MARAAHLWDRRPNPQISKNPRSRYLRDTATDPLTTLLNFLQPLHFVDAGNFAQASHDLFQVFEVGDIEDDFNAGLAVGGVGSDVADVALGVADDAGDVLQHAEAVVAIDGEFNRIGRRRAIVASPLNIDAAFGLIHQIGDVRTAYRVDRDSLAAGDVSDDAFAADGVTTAGAIDEHIALAFDHDGIVIAKYAADDAGNSTGLVGKALSFDIAGHRRSGARRKKARQHLPRGIFSVADTGHEVVNFAKSVTGRHFEQLFVFDLFECDAIFARFLLDDLAADFDGTLALVDVQPVLDLVARAGRLDQAKPVPAGLVSGLGENLDNVAGVQFVAQRHHASVDFGTHAGVTDLGVDGVGEVDRRGIARKHYYFAFRREGVNLFGIEIDFERGKEFVGIADIALPLDHLPQPGETLLILRGDWAVFIFPVRGDS